MADGKVYPIVPGLKMIGEKGIERIESLDEAFLIRLYGHTKDCVQKILIRKICELKGYNLVVDDNDPLIA
jgi:hypothetical protein